MYGILPDRMVPRGADGGISVKGPAAQPSMGDNENRPAIYGENCDVQWGKQERKKKNEGMPKIYGLQGWERRAGGRLGH